jgi:hypothetical protein
MIKIVRFNCQLRRKLLQKYMRSQRLRLTKKRLLQKYTRSQRLRLTRKRLLQKYTRSQRLRLTKKRLLQKLISSNIISQKVFTFQLLNLMKKIIKSKVCILCRHSIGNLIKSSTITLMVLSSNTKLMNKLIILRVLLNTVLLS